MPIDPKLHELPDHVKAALAENSPAKEQNDRQQRDYRFHIRWTAPSGEVFEGWFLHRAPTIAQQIGIYHAIDATCRARSGYFIDTGAQDLLIAICNMEPTLVERPDWAKDLQSIVYPELLLAVSAEVGAHMRCFRGLTDAEAGGATGTDA